MKNEILMTSNYELFTFYEKNRVISPARVLALISSFNKLDLTSSNPIIVNEKMEIVDGQHRFEACKKMEKPIFYTKVSLNGDMDDAINLLNAIQQQWQLIDYIEHFIKRGKKVYQEILDCKYKYNTTISTAISFVSNMESSMSTQIRKGTFKKGEISYSVFGDMHLDFKEIFKDYNHVFFVRAMVTMVKSGKYNHKLDFKRFVKHRYSLLGCANYDQYIKMLEDILNRNRHGGKIHFFDKEK